MTLVCVLTLEIIELPDTFTFDLRWALDASMRTYVWAGTQYLKERFSIPMVGRVSIEGEPQLDENGYLVSLKAEEISLSDFDLVEKLFDEIVKAEALRETPVKGNPLLPTPSGVSLQNPARRSNGSVVAIPAKTTKALAPANSTTDINGN
jgi:hypothetical protein